MKNNEHLGENWSKTLKLRAEAGAHLLSDQMAREAQQRKDHPEQKAAEQKAKK